MLELKNIAKSYTSSRGPVEVLHDIDLRVGPGDFVVVRGASGCGKTTLLLTAGGLLSPDKGSVLVEGRPVYDLSADERARLRSRYYGYVYQQFHLMPYLDVLDNVLVPTLVNRDRLRERAMELIATLQLEHRIHHKPSALSIGERQRVALARALLCKPQILLADEPTGNLDDVNGGIVMDRMSAFAEQGGAVLVVTHDQAIRERASHSFELAEGILK